MMSSYTIDGTTYHVRYIVVEPYRPATFLDPAEGELQPDDEVEVSDGTWITYEEFLHLKQDEMDQDDLSKVEESIMDDLWRGYHTHIGR